MNEHTKAVPTEEEVATLSGGYGEVVLAVDKATENSVLLLQGFDEEKDTRTVEIPLDYMMLEDPTEDFKEIVN